LRRTNMTFEIITTILKQLLDISLVWLVFYYILKNIRNNVRMILLFKGIAFIIFLKIVSNIFGLVTIGLILEYIIMWGPLALIIIFQPEIRNVLEQLGRSQLLGRHKVLTVDERESLVYEVVQAIDNLKRNRIGALIVLERDISLHEYIEKSKKIYADLSNDLLVSIFFPNNPLHDGGVIIQGNRITSVGAVFPVSKSNSINKRLGTRHRAALGISEDTDAIAIVVSEETGRLSIAVKGELNYNLTLDDVRMMLINELRPKKDDLYEEVLKEEEENKEEEEKNEKEKENKD
ncbi:MAG: diadenylate cyclase CdaA, partial [Bacilli bacterium]